MDLIKQPHDLPERSMKGISKVLKELCLAFSGKIIIILATNHHHTFISDDYEKLQIYKPVGIYYHTDLFRDVGPEKGIKLY